MDGDHVLRRPAARFKSVLISFQARKGVMMRTWPGQPIVWE
jgi:hypothetical protein